MDKERSTSMGALMVVTGVIHAALLACVLNLLISVAPTFAALYADFGTALPGATQFLLDLGVFLQSRVLLVIPALALLVGGSCVAAYALARKRRELGWLWFGLIDTLLLMILGLLTLSLYLPLVAISEEL